MAVWEEEVWEVVVRPDREHYEMIDPEGMEFPETVYSRRITLVGDYVRIGRRSRDGKPEIDLSGTLEDVGVSRHHALLMRQPDGTWALVDQGSANGTYLNTEREPIPPNVRFPLQAGDRIHVGAWTTLTVEQVDVSVSPSREVSVPSKDTRGVGRPHQLEICLLGPLRVTVAGNEVTVGSPKVRAVLAVLALRIGRAVSTGQLEWMLWGDREPATAHNALQNHIVALRRLLGPESIETTPQSYRLVGPKDMVDTFRFERRAGRGHDLLLSGHPGAAVAELRLALELWRGDPLPDLVDSPDGAGEVAGLLERRAGAEEDLFEGRLQLGDHEGVVPDLTAAVDEEPLRERRWAQLMLALYRCRRQPEAMQAFQRFRKVLGEEHGLEPSPEIVALERAIVLDKADLRWTPDERGEG
ncbi:MAG TPA: BTAD domain-containing putative transcriptional regulator [Acidimicrobiales bacterium]|nr:BTAD domain-containing putative transcriptional regulator [Acidimicrobiales bacterium]